MGYYADHDRSIQVAVRRKVDAAYFLYHAAGHNLDYEREWVAQYYDALGEAYMWLLRQSNALYKAGREAGEEKPPYKMYSYFVEE